LVWAPNGDYALRTGPTVKLFKSNNTPLKSMKVEFEIEEMFGGELLYKSIAIIF